jgi:hypothetical protein
LCEQVSKFSSAALDQITEGDHRLVDVTEITLRLCE